MMDIDKEQPTIKQYLLRRLDEEGQRRLEERFVTDSEFREVVLVVEDELVEDYLAGALSADERESFVTRYLSAPRQLEELKLSRTLREYATQGAAQRQPADAGDGAAQGRYKIISLLFCKRRLPVLTVAFMLLIVVVVSWNLVSRRRWDAQQAALSAEVALLNRQPAAGESGLTVTLTSVINRSPHESQKVTIPGGMNTVQFMLDLPTGQYQSYETTLRVNDGPELFTVSDLHAEDGGGRLLKLRVPARLLTPEDYVLSVQGVNGVGQSEDVAEYFFRVVK